MSWWEFRGFWGILQRSQAVCLKAVTRQAAGLGPSENDIFGRKVMGVKKFNFIQCVGFVLRFV